MKLEVGRVYVLINGDGAFNGSEIVNKPRVVRSNRVERGPLTGRFIIAVIGLEDHDGLPLNQSVYADQLKPASEKQRVAFNREYFKILHDYKAKGKEVYWL